MLLREHVFDLILSASESIQHILVIIEIFLGVLKILHTNLHSNKFACVDDS